MEGNLPVGDLQTKYKKLASEYSKLKVHVKVFKKGILEEQGKVNALREQLKEKDKQCRKYDVEIDSLNFRNQQLTKRVTVLVEELELLQLKSSKKLKGGKDDKSQSGSSQPSSLNSDLLQEALQKKIMENAQCVSQLSDRAVEVAQLKSRIEDYEKQISDADTKYKAELLKLKNKNQELQQNIDLISKDRSTGTPQKAVAHTGGSSLQYNGDMQSEVGSIIGSEDALSSIDYNEHVCHKVTYLEQENQKLRMEYELLKLELDTLKLDCRKNISSASDKRSGHDSGDFNNDWTSVEADGTVVGLLGKLEVPFTLNDEVISREDNLKKYFRDKLTELKVEKQYVESNMEHLTRECETLRMRYIESENLRLTTERALQEKHDTISRMEDELHSTSRNYEEQMNVLSEHVAQLNDIITTQHEEIDHLKSVKGKRK